MYAIILAGGGRALLAIVAANTPNSFVPVRRKTLLQLAVDRLEGLVERKCLCGYGESYREMVKEQLPQLQWENIIMNPMGVTPPQQ